MYAQLTAALIGRANRIAPVVCAGAIWLFVVSPDDGHNLDLDVHLRNSQRFHT